MTHLFPHVFLQGRRYSRLAQVEPAESNVAHPSNFDGSSYALSLVL